MGAARGCPVQDSGAQLGDFGRFLEASCQAVLLPAPSPRQKLPLSRGIRFGQPPVIPAQGGMRAGGQRRSLQHPGGPDSDPTLGQLGRRRRSDPAASLRFH